MNTNCYRDKLIKHLKKENSFLTIIPDKINYFDIASAQYNLIEKETRLFENADVLIIIPESVGSFAEIGMIASMISNPHDNIHKSKYAEKILIVLDEKYKHDESFLKLGPIKSIKHFGGKIINVNFDLINLNKVTNKITRMQTRHRKYFNISNNRHCSLFLSNSIKILLYIYYHKTIEVQEQEYKKMFINKLKTIHKSIEIDNIEYLESTELIIKENLGGKVTIKVNHNHTFIEKLLERNFNFFLKHNLIYNFLERSGY